MMRAMRILHVIPSISPELGGPSVAIINIARGLMALGAHVEIATTDDGFGRMNSSKNSGAQIQHQELNIHYFKQTGHPLKQFLYSNEFKKWLPENIRGYDVIHTHYAFSFMPNYAEWCAKKHQIPYITRPLGTLLPWARKQHALKKAVYFNLIQRSLLLNAAGIHCTSENEANNINELIRKKSAFVTPHGLAIPETLPRASELLRERLQIHKDSKIILYLGRLVAKKRPDYLIQEFTRLKGENIYLVMAGSGAADYEGYLRGLVSKTPAYAKVRFVGHVEGEDKNLFLQGSDIFALPSYSENFGISVAEAMAVARPVIVSRGVDVAGQINEANAGIVIDGENGECTAAIKKLLDNPHASEEMSQNAILLMKNKFTPEACAKKLIDKYQWVLERANTSHGGHNE
jgi:glycosyltransferase involved in cell wall biosynthesis